MGKMAEMRAFRYYNLIKKYDWDHAEALAILQHESTDRDDEFSKNISVSDSHPGWAPRSDNDYDYTGVIGYFEQTVDENGNTVYINDFRKTPWWGSYGVFQVSAGTLLRHRSTGLPWYPIPGYVLTNVRQLFNPAVNIAMAYNLWRQHRDWRDWSAYKNGSYLHSLPATQAFVKAKEAELAPKQPAPATPEPKPVSVAILPQASPLEGSLSSTHNAELYNQGVKGHAPKYSVVDVEWQSGVKEVAQDASQYGAEQATTWFSGKFAKSIDRGQRWLKIGGVGAGIHQASDKWVMDWSANHVEWGGTALKIEHLTLLVLAAIVGMVSIWSYKRVKNGTATIVEKQIAHFFAWKQRGVRTGKMDRFN